MLYGCIPVFVGADVPPFADVIDWTRVSVRVEKPSLISRLHEQLGNYSHKEVVRMRQGLRAVWQRLLWTRALRMGLLGRPRRPPSVNVFGTSYLGEDGSDDAFATLVEVLRRRLVQ